MSEQPETYMPVIVEDRSVALNAFNSMVAEIPEAGEDALESIIAAIATTETAADLDKPWRTDSMRELSGRELVIESVEKAESDYEDGLGWYLVVHFFDTTTGERTVGTTGAVGIVAQLIRAHHLKAFPLKVIVRVAERATKKGYHPMHLEIMR